MKKVMKIFRSKLMVSIMAFVLAAGVLSSCGEDDKKDNNYFKVDGTTVKIKTSVFNYDAVPSESPVTGEDYYRHWIFLLGDGFTVNTNTGTISGSGNMVELAISGATINLDPGTYTFTGTEEDPQPFELWDGRVTYNGNEYIFEEATLTIAKSGNTFTIEFTATMYPPDENEPWLPDLTQSSKSLSGRFSGTLINIEDN
jgi:hypothetical protein